jgi:hypothetical protein
MQPTRRPARLWGTGDTSRASTCDLRLVSRRAQTRTGRAARGRGAVGRPRGGGGVGLSARHRRHRAAGARTRGSRTASGECVTQGVAASSAPAERRPCATMTWRQTRTESRRGAECVTRGVCHRAPSCCEVALASRPHITSQPPLKSGRSHGAPPQTRPPPQACCRCTGWPGRWR